MTSLQDLLPEPGTSNWRKGKSYSTDSGDVDDATVRHVVIREVWLENRPTPHAVYKVDVMSRSAHWSVFRRYREFYQLHQVLMKKYGISKDLLPPRKLTNSLAKDTLYKRREALEHFLQRVINSCGRGVSCCDEVVDFLDAKSHDVALVSHTLAKFFKEKGETILASGQGFQFTPSQLYCITKQLRLPHPWSGQRVDLSYLYDFVNHIQKVVVSDMIATASKGQQHMSNVSYDLSLFSSLRELQLDGCQISSIKGLSNLPGKLRKLAARYSIRSLKELLVDSATETRKAPSIQTNAENWRAQAAMKLVENRMIVQPWVCLTNINLSHNYISVLDSALSLLPTVKELDLSYNRITHLDLSLLDNSTLQKLSLVANEIYLISGSTKTNEALVELNLRLNRIHTIEGLLCLQVLENLDLAHNSIVLLAEIRKLGALPRLRKLWVAGNPFAKRKRHRVMSLYYFRKREFELDGKPMTGKEKAKIESKLRSKEDGDGQDDNMSISTVSDDDLDSGIDEHGQAPRLEPLLEEEYLIIGADLEPISISKDMSQEDLVSRRDDEDDVQPLSHKEDGVVSETRSRDEWDQILQSKNTFSDNKEQETNNCSVDDEKSTLLAQSKVWEESDGHVSIFERLNGQDSPQSSLTDKEVLYPPDNVVRIRTASKVIQTIKPPDSISNGSDRETLTLESHVRPGTLLHKSLSIGNDEGVEKMPVAYTARSDVDNGAKNSFVDIQVDDSKVQSTSEIEFEWRHYQPQVKTDVCQSATCTNDNSNMQLLRVESVDEIQATESTVASAVNYDDYDNYERAEECSED